MKHKPPSGPVIAIAVFACTGILAGVLKLTGYADTEVLEELILLIGMPAVLVCLYMEWRANR